MTNDFEFEDFLNDLDSYKNSSSEKHSEVVGLIARGVGFVSRGVGEIAKADARKKEAELKRVEIGGKRTAQLKACEENKAFKKFLDRKWRNNRIRDCKTEVNKRLDAEDNEQKEIIKRMSQIEKSKVNIDIEKSINIDEIEKKNTEEKKYSKKLFLIGGIVGSVLILGTIIFIYSKKK